jgi:UDP-2,4-diacetamido-2,4,6-trideoxy-beta-L-altropyranose hydrolase
MRCLTLATELRRRGAEVSFISQNLPGHVGEIITSKEFKLHLVPQSPMSEDASITHEILAQDKWEWLVVDHYSIDEEWEKKQKKSARKLLVIDDLADRNHEADLLVDQNYYLNLESRYDSKVLQTCKKLLGPTYCLLREEFVNARDKKIRRDGSLKNIFVNFGGVDQTHETVKVLEAFKKLKLKGINISVIVGMAQDNKEEIKVLCESIGASFNIQVSNISDFMAKADLAIGAGGTSSWERCCLGLPSLVTILAENQRQLAEDLSVQGAILKLGWAKDLTFTNYADAISNFTAEKLNFMGKKASNLVDGRGVSRVADNMEEIL